MTGNNNFIALAPILLCPNASPVEANAFSSKCGQMPAVSDASVMMTALFGRKQPRPPARPKVRFLSPATDRHPLPHV